MSSITPHDASAASIGDRDITLTNGWSFALTTARDDMSRPPRAGWRRVRVPHVFTAAPRSDAYPGAVGWYRARLRVPAGGDGTRWRLRFDQVRRTATIWLNGLRLGDGQAFVPTLVQLPRSASGRVNELLVRVDNRMAGARREGWWNWGGITRPVTLEARRSVALDDVGLIPTVECDDSATCRAKVMLDCRVRNYAEDVDAARISVRIRAPSGHVYRARTTLRALGHGASRRIRMTIPIDRAPELWSPQQPLLHQAEVSVEVGRRSVAATTMRIGLRSVRVRDGHLELNGKRLVLRGASIHEDLAGRGAALRESDLDRIVAELEALGANVTRAHYPLNERLLQRLDRAGILVWSQAPVYQTRVDLSAKDGVKHALTLARAAVHATRNHPSVIAHSVANELVDAPDLHASTREYLVRAAQLVRDLDHSVAVAVDVMGHPGFAPQRTYEAFDALGLNTYFGWYPGPGGTTSDLSGLEPYLNGMRVQYPRHALVMTEFGAEAKHPGPADQKGTFEFQTQYLSRILDVVDSSSAIDGAIYWTLREFAIRPGWLGGLLPGVGIRSDGIHHKGLISYDGRAKPAWHVIQARFHHALGRNNTSASSSCQAC